MLVRLAATRMSHGTPSVLPTSLGNSSISRWRCSGFIAAIWLAIRSWPIADQPATTSASGTGHAPASPVPACGACGGFSAPVMSRAVSVSAPPSRSRAATIPVVSRSLVTCVLPPANETTSGDVPPPATEPSSATANPSARAAETSASTSSRAELICSAPSRAATAAVIRHRDADAPPDAIVPPWLRAASAADPVQK